MSKKKKKVPTKHHPIKAPVEVPMTLCNDIEVLTFDKFIKCAVNKDYSVLIISGKPSKDELFRAWITILSQYYSLIESKDAAKYIKTVSKIEAYHTKIFIVSGIIEALRQIYNEKLCDELCNWGFNKTFSRETIAADLDQVERELGNDRYKLEKFRVDYERSEKEKKKKGGGSTKEGYMKVLYAIENHRKMPMQADEITVYKFCILYKELEEYNQHLIAKNKANGSR